MRDEVSEDVITEGTNDWFAQAKDGTVWYCGEETATFETFEGDRLMKPELVSIDGSFKAGRDGDKPGIIFLANPMPGQVYIEESSLGNAEDATKILSIDYSYGKDPKLDQLVPPKLAQPAQKNCVVTGTPRRWSPRGRAQILCARHRRIPRDRAANGRSRAPGEVQRRPEVRCYRNKDSQALLVGQAA